MWLDIYMHSDEVTTWSENSNGEWVCDHNTSRRNQGHTVVCDGCNEVVGQDERTGSWVNPTWG